MKSFISPGLHILLGTRYSYTTTSLLFSQTKTQFGTRNVKWRFPGFKTTSVVTVWAKCKAGEAVDLISAVSGADRVGEKNMSEGEGNEVNY
jgi:hypothetical protein